VAVEVTPLGFKKPDGNERVRDGDNVISENAQKANDLLLQDRARLANLENAAGFPGDPLEFLDSVVAGVLATGEDSQAVLDAEISEKVPPAVAAVIATDPTVLASAANMAQSTVGLVPVWKASTAYTAGQRVIAPDGDIVSAKVNFTSGASYSSANWNLSDVRWSKGQTYPGGDLFTFAGEGSYYVSSGASIPNWPAQMSGVGGHVEFRNRASVKSITVWGYGVVAGIYSTQTDSTAGAGTFKPWRRIDNPYQGRLLPGADALDLARVDGDVQIRSNTDAAAIANLPVALPGILRTVNMPQVGLGVRFVIFFAQGASQGGMYFNWTNTTVGSHTWVGWQKIATKADVDAVAAQVQAPIGLNHEVLLDEFTRRRGGKIGTAGKAVIALRFDDPINGLINSGVATELANLGIPASAAHCSGSFTAADLIALSNLGTWTTVRDWALKQGMEVWHHGGNHQDATGTAALTGQIITSLTTLKTSLPALEVNKWMQPGVGGTNYDGFAFTDKAELWYQHPAGKMILTEHAISSGQIPGLIRQLDGKPRNGLLHTMVDAPAKLAAVYDHIDAAIEEGAGLCIMLHPNNLDKVGDYITSTDYKTLLAYLATLRDQGVIEILTVSGLLCADSDSGKWTQLIRNGTFAAGLTKWLGTSGWTATGGVASTAGTTLLAQSQSMLRHGWMRGGTMQLRAEVRATTGAVVRLQQYSDLDAPNWTAEKDVTLSASTDWVPVRLNACVPLTLSADDYVWAKVGRVSGGTIEVRNVEYRPV